MNQPNPFAPSNVNEATFDTNPKFEGPRRFWLKSGTQKQIIFLSDAEGEYGPANFPEHTISCGRGKMRHRNFFTCLRVFGKPCPLCEMAEKWSHGYASQVYVFTILNITPWEDRNGQTHNCTKELFVAKKTTIEALKIHAQNLKNANRPLRGTEFQVHRTTASKSPGAGDLFVPGQTYDIEQLRQHGLDVEPFDYEEIFTPKMEEIEDIIRRKNEEIGQGISQDYGNDQSFMQQPQQFQQQPQQMPQMPPSPLPQQPQAFPPQQPVEAPQPQQQAPDPAQVPGFLQQQNESSESPSLESPAFMQGPPNNQGQESPPFNPQKQEPPKPPVTNNVQIDYS